MDRVSQELASRVSADHFAAVRRADGLKARVERVMLTAWARAMHALVMLPNISARIHAVTSAFAGFRRDVPQILHAGLADEARRSFRVHVATLKAVLPKAYFQAAGLRESILDPHGRHAPDGTSGRNRGGGGSTGGLGVDLFSPPTDADVSTVISETNAPDGKSWEDRLADLTRLKGLDTHQIATVIALGMALGKNPREIGRDLEPLVGGYKATAERIARTESMRVSHTMAKRAEGPLAGQSRGYRILATLDTRTRPEHAARNGTLYLKPEYFDSIASEKKEDISECPSLPDAPNCRCRTVMVMRPLGDVLDDLHGQPKPPSASAAPPRPEPDKPFVNPVTSADWWRRLSQRDQRAVVGSEAFDIVSDKTRDVGGPELTDFTPDPGTGELAAPNALAQTSLDDVLARRAAAGLDQPPIPDVQAAPPPITIAPIPTGSSRAVEKAFVQTLEDVPASVRRQVDISEARIVLSPAAALGPLANQTPPGYPQGQTWSDAPAWWSSSDNSISLAPSNFDPSLSGQELKQYVRGLVRHEVGHALDDSLDGSHSNDDPFLDAYIADLDALTRANRDPRSDNPAFAYYMQPGSAGRGELFAEMYAVATGGGSDLDITSREFLRAFPRSARIVRAIIAGRRP